MRRFDKTKHIQRLNEKLNKEKSTLNEYHEAFNKDCCKKSDGEFGERDTEPLEEGPLVPVFNEECIASLHSVIKNFTHNNPNAVPDRDYNFSDYGPQAADSSYTGVGRFLFEFDGMDDFQCNGESDYYAIVIDVDTEVYDYDDARLMFTRLLVFDSNNELIYEEDNSKKMVELFPLSFMESYERTIEYMQQPIDAEFNESKEKSFNLLNEGTTEMFKKLCGVKVTDSKTLKKK
jgi:hypothetical protein